MKTCTFCKHRKPLLDFGRNGSAKDGLHYYCKMCAALKRKAWYELNKPKAITSMRKWKARTKEANQERDPYEQAA